jgi:ABC-type uncharacterized transport system fused permease/ATPase subunit
MDSASSFSLLDIFKTLIVSLTFVSVWGMIIMMVAMRHLYDYNMNDKYPKSKILPSSLALDFSKKISEKDKSNVQRMLGDYIRSFIPGIIFIVIIIIIIINIIIIYRYLQR